MKKYTDAELNAKIHTFLDDKLNKFPEIQRKSIKKTHQNRIQLVLTGITSSAHKRRFA